MDTFKQIKVKFDAWSLLNRALDAVSGSVNNIWYPVGVWLKDLLLIETFTGQLVQERTRSTLPPCGMNIYNIEDTLRA